MSSLTSILMFLTLVLGVSRPALAARIVVPKARVFTSAKDAYKTGPGEQILVIMHLPKEAGTTFIEVYNRTKQEISLFQFTLTALGHEGELEFDSLPAGWSAVKEVKLGSIRELALRNPKAFNANADEITPTLVIHHVKVEGKAPQVGKRKI